MWNWQSLCNRIACCQLRLSFAFFKSRSCGFIKDRGEMRLPVVPCLFQAFQSFFFFSLLFLFYFEGPLKKQRLLSFSSPLDKLCSALWENWPQITGNILKWNKTLIGPSVPLGVFQTYCPPGWILYLGIKEMQKQYMRIFDYLNVFKSIHRMHAVALIMQKRTRMSAIHLFKAVYYHLN